jgi:hypothetical protein
MSTFQDREEAIAQICAESDQSVLLNIYGEAGIGKSRLISEAVDRLRAKSPPPLVLSPIDLQPVADTESYRRPEMVLRKIIARAENRLSDIEQDIDHAAGQVVAKLIELSRRKPVYLMLDTTEALQEDMDFWRWMEAYLVGPLAVERGVRQVFAGRVPVPWRRLEVRRAVKHLPLTPLTPQDGANSLVEEELVQHNPQLSHDETLEQAVSLILEFSFGHPLLSEKLAAYVAPNWPTPTPKEFRREICAEVVKPFVDEFLFEGIDTPWDDILWWASALDWFDATVLQRYLKHVVPQLVEGKPDYFFIQGITHLRIRHTVVWREERGDRLHGVVANIVRQCLEVLDPARYRQACQAAADTLEDLAKEFPAEYPEVEQYRLEAKEYRQRAKPEEGEK